jgi:hypothetical protein
MKEVGRPIPPPSVEPAEGYTGKWQLRAPKSLHRRLAERAKREGVSLNTLAISLLAEKGSARARHMAAEGSGGPGKGGATRGRRSQKRGPGKRAPPTLLQEHYAPELPPWLASARVFPTSPVDPKQEKDETRRQASELIEQLVDRRPLSWPPKAADEDDAREALLVAGQLFSLLAGWAVSQELAGAARRTGVKLGPTQLWVPSAAERLISSDGWVILHQLDAILRIFEGCSPLTGCEVIRDQIRALLAGDDSIVFRPQRGRRTGEEGYRLWVLRARAVAHAEFLVRRGMTKTKARETVATAYRHWREGPGEVPSADNIKTWGRRAPAILGDDIVDWYLDRAREEATQSIGFQAFGEAQLQEDGENYCRLIRGEEPLGPDKARSTVLILREPGRPGVHMEMRGPAPQKATGNL